MKATTKKYLLWGGIAYAAYYWYQNYGPGKAAANAAAAAQSQTNVNAIAAAQQMAQQGIAQIAGYQQTGP